MDAGSPSQKPRFGYPRSIQADNIPIRAVIFQVLNQIELPPIEAEPDAEALENIRIEIEVDDDAPEGAQ